MKPSVFLPRELWEEIIALCSRDDIVSLALTHRFFTPSCADNLFRNVTITDWWLDTLVPRLEGLSSPRVAARIQTLTLAIVFCYRVPYVDGDPTPPRNEEERNAWISTISTTLLRALEKMINLREYLHGDVLVGKCDYPFTNCLESSLPNLPRLRRFQFYGHYDGVLRTAIIRNLEEVSIHLTKHSLRELTYYPFLSHSRATLRKVSCEVGTVLGEADGPDHTHFISLLRSTPLLEDLDATFVFSTQPRISLDVAQFNVGQATRHLMRELRKDMTPLPNLRRLKLSVVTPGGYPSLKDWPAILSIFIAGRNLEALGFDWTGRTQYPDVADILDPLDDLTSLTELVFPLSDHEDFVTVIAAISRRAPNLRKLELWNFAGIIGYSRCSKSELKRKAPRLAAELGHFKNLWWLKMSEPMPSDKVMLDYAKVLGAAAPKLRQVSFCGNVGCRFIRDVNGGIIDVLDMSSEPPGWKNRDYGHNED